MISLTMSRLARVAVVMLACHVLAGEARAQQPSAGATAAARELIELKGAGSMVDPVIAGTIDRTKGALLTTNPQLSKDLNEVSAQLRSEFAPRRNELLTEAAKFYAQAFNEQELKDLVAFYKSPLGKKMLEREPAVLDQVFALIQDLGPRIGEQVMNRFRVEMKKKGHDL